MNKLIIIGIISLSLLHIAIFTHNKRWLKTTIYTLVLAIIFCPVSGILGYSLGIFNGHKIVEECPKFNCPTFEECKNKECEPCPEMEVVYQQDEALFLCQEVFNENEKLKTNNEELKTTNDLLELSKKDTDTLISELRTQKEQCERKLKEKIYTCEEQLKILTN